MITVWEEEISNTGRHRGIEDFFEFMAKDDRLKVTLVPFEGKS